MRARAVAVVVLATIACADNRPPERYGFVGLLGRDTVAAERVTRTSNRLITDGVDKWPFVRQRHTVIDFAEDGRLTSMVMDIRTPSGTTPAERERHVTARFANDSVFVLIRDSSGVRDTVFATRGMLTVPHVSMMYSIIELQIASAMAQATTTKIKAGDSVQFRQFYPDRNIGSSFALHRGFIIPRDSGKVELRHDWLAGTGDVTVDSAGRLLSYSGARSTYKVAVKRTNELPDITSIVVSLAAAEQRAGASQLSVRDTVQATIGQAQFTIDYGRPLARGRTLLGDVISYNEIWRTGANAATQFTNSVPVIIGDLTLAAGTYTLWTITHLSRVDLIVNSQSGQWGTQYNSSLNVGTVPMQSEMTRDSVEKFTISIVPDADNRGTLVMEWGTFRWTVPIGLK